MGMWFCSTDMEEISKIDHSPGCKCITTLAGAVWGVLDGVMALYEGSSTGIYYVFDKGRVESHLLANLQVQEQDKEHVRWDNTKYVQMNMGYHSCL